MVASGRPTDDRRQAHGRRATRIVAQVALLPGLDHPLNVLFMGTDVDYVLRHGKEVLGLRGNTDTMILARLDPTHQQVHLLSIPRDTRVPIPGHGTFKINAANPYGGPKLAEKS